MYCLKLRYQVKKVNDFFMIQDCITSEAVMAFKVKDIAFNKLKEIIYHGIEETAEEPEAKLGKQLLKKDADLFIQYEKKESRELLNLVRNYTEFFLRILFQQKRFKNIWNFLKAL
ncbi:hypothetical protein GQR36_11255 [Enterococcus termitis]